MLVHFDQLFLQRIDLRVSRAFNKDKKNPIHSASFFNSHSTGEMLQMEVQWKGEMPPVFIFLSH